MSSRYIEATVDNNVIVNGAKAEEHIMQLSSLSIPYNFQKNPPSQDKINKKMAMIQNGENIKLTIDEHNNLLNGYASYLAYIKLGYKECACMIVEQEISTNISMPKKLLIYEAAGGKCYICGRKCNRFGEAVTNTFEHDNLNATLDHLVPLRKGGTNDYTNLRLCCRQCNTLKSDFTFSEELVKVIKNELREKGLLQD